jgi:hypothetical protein
VRQKGGYSKTGGQNTVLDTKTLFWSLVVQLIKRDEEVKIRHVNSSWWGGISSFMDLEKVHWLYNNTSINKEIEQAIVNGDGAKILL